MGSAPLSFLQESCEWETLRLPKPGIPGDHMIHTANDTGKPTRLPGLLRQGRWRDCFSQSMPCSTHSVHRCPKQYQPGVYSTLKAHRLPAFGCHLWHVLVWKHSLLADQHFQSILSSVSFVNFCLDYSSCKKQQNNKKPLKPTKTLLFFQGMLV